MKKIGDPSEIEKICRALSSATRVRIIDFLVKAKEPVTLTQIHKFFNDEFRFITIQNHCKKLQEAGIVDIWREGGRYLVKIKRIPHVYIEELE